MLRLGWFSTGRDEAARDLLTRVVEDIQRGELDARIQFVFCNRDPGETEDSDQFQALARSYGLPLVTLSSRRFRQERSARSFDKVREAFDQEVLRRLDRFDVDLCVLAGYMLYASAELCQRFAMVNLHPALPTGPIGTWQEVIWQLIEQRAPETGAMIHLATEDWDRGPVITYYSFSLTGPTFDPLWEQVGDRSVEELKATHSEDLPLFQRIRSEGMKRELPLLMATLRALAEGRVSLREGKVVNAQGRPIEGYCLTEEMNREVLA